MDTAGAVKIWIFCTTARAGEPTIATPETEQRAGRRQSARTASDLLSRFWTQAVGAAAGPVGRALAFTLGDGRSLRASHGGAEAAALNIATWASANLGHRQHSRRGQQQQQQHRSYDLSLSEEEPRPAKMIGTHLRRRGCQQEVVRQPVSTWILGRWGRTARWG